MELFQEIGGNLINSYSMADMELVRTGANTYFKKPNDGWIECIVSKVGTHNVLKHTMKIRF